MQRFAVFLSVLCCGVSLPVHAHGFYTKAGVLGAGAGYFHGVTDHVSLRTDFTSVRRLARDVASRVGNYTVGLQANQWGVYGDWFPFGNGFRFSGGMHVRKLHVQAHGRPADGAFVLRFGPIKWPVTFTSADAFMAQVRFPTVAPYLGIGWGYHDTQTSGLAIVFDVGVSFGKPRARLVISKSLQTKIKLAKILGVSAADALVKAQRQKLDDMVRKFKVFPQMYLGISYRF